MLKQMADEAARLGYRRGESAKQWHKRDPQAAAKMAEWTKTNEAMITASLRDAMLRAECHNYDIDGNPL